MSEWRSHCVTTKRESCKSTLRALRKCRSNLLVLQVAKARMMAQLQQQRLQQQMMVQVLPLELRTSGFTSWIVGCVTYPYPNSLMLNADYAYRIFIASCKIMVPLQ